MSAPAAAPMAAAAVQAVTSLAEVQERIFSAMDRIRQLNKQSAAASAAAAVDAPRTRAAPAGQAPGATPVGLALGAVLKALEGSSAQQTGSLADTPSAVHLRAGGAANTGGDAQQQSSTAINEYLAQLAAAALQQSSTSGAAGGASPPTGPPSSSSGTTSGEDSYGR
ncbi:hypothetical protein ABPG77_002225, partial [Micractinium sp. CCAP 211/92]